MKATHSTKLSPEEVAEEIAAALAHKNVDRWKDTELYVARWLGREARSRIARPALASPAEPEDEERGPSIPELTAPPGALWPEVIDNLRAAGILPLNVESVRQWTRCLGWAGDLLVVAFARGYQIQQMELPLERAIATALGMMPEVLYVREPELEEGTE